MPAKERYQLVVGVAVAKPRHPWAAPYLPRRAGSADVARAPGAAVAQSTRPIAKRARHSAELAMAIVRALATATAAEVAVAYGLTVGQVAGIASRAGAPRRPRGETSAPVVVEDVPRTMGRPRLPDGPVAVPSAVHGTGIRLVDVGHGACRALDDAGDCCARPAWRGTSWCPAHARAYFRCAEVA